MRLQHAMEKIWCETNSAAARRHDQRVDAVVLVITIARNVNSILVIEKTEGKAADDVIRHHRLDPATVPETVT
jgi:hypothetical protein